jgi:hypothetical protein
MPRSWVQSLADPAKLYTAAGLALSVTESQIRGSLCAQGSRMRGLHPDTRRKLSPGAEVGQVGPVSAMCLRTHILRRSDNLSSMLRSLDGSLVANKILELSQGHCRPDTLRTRILEHTPFSDIASQARASRVAACRHVMKVQPHRAERQTIIAVRGERSLSSGASSRRVDVEGESASTDNIRGEQRGPKHGQGGTLQKFNEVPYTYLTEIRDLCWSHRRLYVADRLKFPADW